MVSIIFLDLDGTLLRSDKTISPRTRAALERCRERGILIATATARSTQRLKQVLGDVKADLFLSNNGALVTMGERTLFRESFGPEELRRMLDRAVELTGGADVTVNMPECNYWAWKSDPAATELLGETGWHCRDYRELTGGAFKFCVATADPSLAEAIRAAGEDCLALPYSDIPWYQFTKKAATKGNAVRRIGEALGIPREEMLGFGDDWPDLDLLRACGTGVAMGNAIPEVKAAADYVTASNDEDGIAVWLEEHVLI